MVRFLENDPDIVGNLLAGFTNGATYHVGLAKVPADGALQFTAFASANQVLAVASSCAVDWCLIMAVQRTEGSR